MKENSMQPTLSARSENRVPHGSSRLSLTAGITTAGVLIFAPLSIAVVNDGTDPILQATGGNITLGDLTGGILDTSVIFRTNGADRARFDKNGRLLVNTTSSDAQAHIRGSTVNVLKLSQSGTTNTNVMLQATPTGTGFFALNSFGGSSGFIFGSGDPGTVGVGKELMRLQNNAYLGIGTNGVAPRGPLDVSYLAASTNQEDRTLANFTHTTSGGRNADFQIDYRGLSLGLGTLAFQESRAGKDFMVVNMLTSGTTNGNRIAFPNGQIAIGTAVPGKKVDIMAPSGDGLRIRGATGTEASSNLFLEPTSTNTNKRNWVLSAYGDLYGDFSIRNSNAPNDNPYGPTGTTRFIINQDGKVGIGTNMPSAKLEVSSTQASDGYAIVASSNQQYKQLLIKATGTAEAGYPFIKFDGEYGRGTPNGGAEFYQNSTGKVFVNINGGKNGITINPTGELGIGTMDPTPGMMLDVRGHARITGDITVASVRTNSWTVTPPDYVFEKEYKLTSLEEVDAFVKKNKHLPEVPSANDFKKKGMDLAEMNFVLLRKVEELTLHAIRQEKEMKKQADEIRKLRADR